MNDSVIKLSYNEKEIILIPTAHVSWESVELVKHTIDKEQPDAICIELDDARYENIKNPQKWKDTNLIDVIKEKKVGLLIANLILSSYQRNIAKKLKTTPGQEMIEGMKSAEEYGSSLILADRNLQTTFMRIWRSLTFWGKCKLLLSFIFDSDMDEEVTEQDLQNLMEQDNLENIISDMGSEFPEIAQILLHERDQYLAYKIKNAPGKKIVAILGAAHVPGVEKEIFLDQDIEEITKIPKPSVIGKILPWIIPAVILFLLGYGFVSGIQNGLSQLKSWVLWNSLFAALFTLLALGHPLSILTAFVVAPFTSLNPLLACGWFAGLVEATVRKPTVKDVDNVHNDIFHIKSVLQNRFLKALLIIIFANIGSTIGTIVASLDIVKNLF
ncbi:MAG: TraB/GumN family protein [Tissierellia bacterium]|nr:TraB/GumN family protein [Tissierellia bacterium]